MTAVVLVAYSVVSAPVMLTSCTCDTGRELPEWFTKHADQTNQKFEALHDAISALHQFARGRRRRRDDADPIEQSEKLHQGQPDDGDGEDFWESQRAIEHDGKRATDVAGDIKSLRELNARNKQARGWGAA